MAKAALGDIVRLHYTVKLKNGSVYDSTRDRDPLQVTLGRYRLISGFEEAVVGMEPGESKSSVIPAARAFGEWNPKLQFKVPRHKVEDGVRPSIGRRMEVKWEGDQRTVLVTVKDVSEDEVTLDANHPLAGRDLVFEIDLLEIAPS
jgi:peptidylprolyl isomerase